MADAILFVLASLFYFCSGTLWAYFFRLGTRWARVPNVNFSRALWISFTIHTSFATLSLALACTELGKYIHAGATLYCLLWLGQFVFFKWALRATLWQAVRSWLPTLSLVIIQLAVVALIVRPFILEAFTIPTNSMAPTVLGTHVATTCPECEATAYRTQPHSDYPPSYMKPWCICENFHQFQEHPRRCPVEEQDRIIVLKTLRPKRWDLIVFRYPEEPSTRYLKRLVGLPGETIEIRDGACWVNNERLVPPNSIAGLRYTSEVYGQKILHGAEPLTLAADEHFVLGDFSNEAKDSRFWTSSKVRPAAPYAVLTEEILGVATHVYGRRWKSLAP